MAIGLVLIAGALSVFINSRKTYAINQGYARMLENGNFALDEISRALQLAGYFGFSSQQSLVKGRTGDTAFTPLGDSHAATNECEAGWYADVAKRVEGLDDDNEPWDDTCILDSRYTADTDVLVVRYAEPEEIASGDLQDDTVYIRADTLGAQLFVGTTQPSGFATNAANFKLRAIAFYVSDFSLTAGDDIPALKKVELEAGPIIDVPSTPNAREIVAPGIENMQIQYGLTSAADSTSANEYRNAGNIADADWSRVVSVRIWVIVRAEDLEKGFSNNTGSFRLPAGVFTPSELDAPNDNDGFRRIVLSRTVSLRNI
jgi:type IV pilus assembly protein PilW